jgi:hypothetical protein
LLTTGLCTFLVVRSSLEAKEDQPPTHQLPAEKDGLFNGNPMHLMQVVKEQCLVGKLKPVGKTEKGRADHYHARTQREKGTSKEKVPVPEEEAIRKPAQEAVKMVVQSEEEFMLRMLLMTRRNKRPEVLVRAKALLVLEMIKVAKPLKARVAEAPVNAAKAPQASYPVSTDLGGEEGQGKDNTPHDQRSFHDVGPPELVLLTSRPHK